MDLQKLIEKVVKTLTENEDLMREFMENPTRVLEKKFGVDLPDDQINAVVDGIKAKIKFDDAAEFAGKLFGMFGKK